MKREGKCHSSEKKTLTSFDKSSKLAGVFIGSIFEVTSVSGAAMFKTDDNVVVLATPGGGVRGLTRVTL